jgi:hypothetical protein
MFESRRQKQELEEIQADLDNHIPITVSTTRGKSYEFTIRELRFLDALRKGMNLGQAVKATKIDWEQGYNLLKRSVTREYMGDLAYERVQKEGFTPERWFNEGLKVLSGEKKVDRQQMVVWQELGSRIMPRAKEGGSEKGVTINIDMRAVEEASRRLGKLDEVIDVGTGDEFGTEQQS